MSAELPVVDADQDQMPKMESPRRNEVASWSHEDDMPIDWDAQQLHNQQLPVSGRSQPKESADMPTLDYDFFESK